MTLNPKARFQHSCLFMVLFLLVEMQIIFISSSHHAVQAPAPKSNHCLRFYLLHLVDLISLKLSVTVPLQGLGHHLSPGLSVFPAHSLPLIFVVALKYSSLNFQHDLPKQPI